MTRQRWFMLTVTPWRLLAMRDSCVLEKVIIWSRCLRWIRVLTHRNTRQAWSCLILNLLYPHPTVALMQIFVQVRRKDLVKSSKFWIHSFNNLVRESETICTSKYWHLFPQNFSANLPALLFVSFHYFYPVTSSHQFLELKMRWTVPSMLFLHWWALQRLPHLSRALLTPLCLSWAPGTHTPLPGSTLVLLSCKAKAQPSLWALGGFGCLSPPQLHLTLTIILGRFHVFTAISE